MKQENEKFCHSCGNAILRDAEFCPNCGAKQTAGYGTVNSKWLATLLLCFFLGVFGAHRFFTGHIGLGILQLVTLGGCGIWYIVDLIIIITGNFKDAQGVTIKSNL